MKKLLLIFSFLLWMPTAHALTTFELVESLAKTGNVLAQYNLGYMYTHGTRSSQNDAKVMQWSRKAAWQEEYAESEYNLDYQYAKQLYVNQSYIYAHMWYFFSSISEFERAKDAFKYLKGKMTNREIEIAKKLAGDCWKFNFKDCKKSWHPEFEILIGKKIFDFFFFVAATLTGTFLAYIFKIRHEFNKLRYSNEFDKGKLALDNEKHSEAMQIWKPLAEEGYMKAQRYIGWMYRHGKGVRKNLPKAFEWYEKAAIQGDSEAQFYIARIHQRGIGVKQDYDEAIKWYKQAAEQGHLSAQNNLGWMYAHEEGFVEQDFEEAFKWYEKAADTGSSSAQNNLGWMYQKGEGVEQDFEEARNWYRQAAEQGNIYAQNNLGDMYRTGEGNKQDYGKAMKWYKKSAKKENAIAQYYIGLMYDNGNGVEQDFEEAMKWYKKAAKQKLASAQSNIGLMYDSGNGVVQDYKKAIKWYHKAAKQGNKVTQYNLGILYSSPSNEFADNIKAYMWLSVAKINGYEDEDAQERLDKLKKIMSAADVENAEEMAKECTESDYTKHVDDIVDVEE